MKVSKKINVQGQWAKAGEDFKDKDSLKILNAGEKVTGEYGEQDVFSVETKNGERNLRFNQTTLNNLIDAWGTETESWVNQMVTAFVIQGLVSGKMRNICYLAPQGSEIKVDGEGNISFDWEGKTENAEINQDVEYPEAEDEELKKANPFEK